MNPELQYPDHFIDRLHIIWGKGFLSPGGRDEILKIVRGLDLKNRSVLDIGCGTGGPSMVLAEECDANVIGIEPHLIARSKEAVDDADLSA